MKYTQVPNSVFKELQLNAGILVDEFDPETGLIGKIIGATSGGVQFNATPTYTDFGADIDNMPKNTMELKRLESWDVKLSGTMLTVTPTMLKDLIGAADIDPDDETHIIPRNELLVKDFKEAWWVGDYSDKNTDDNAGFIAIHVMNTLNTSGISIKSGDKVKGTMSFEYAGHYSIADIDKVPFEIFVKQGEDDTPALGTLNVTSAEGTATGDTELTVTPAKASGNSYYYKTAYGTAPTVSYGDDVTSWTSWDGSEEITATTGHKITVVEADGEGKAVKAGSATVTSKEQY